MPLNVNLSDGVAVAPGSAARQNICDNIGQDLYFDYIIGAVS